MVPLKANTPVSRVLSGALRSWAAIFLRHECPAAETAATYPSIIEVRRPRTVCVAPVLTLLLRLGLVVR